MAAYIKTLKDSAGVDTIYPQTKSTAVFTEDNKTVETALQEKLTTPSGTQGQLLGFTADNVVGAVTASGGLYSDKFVGTLSTAWTKSGTSYYQQINVTGMTDDQQPIVFPNWTAAKANEELAWSSISSGVESFNGYVRFYAQAPTKTAVNFTLIYKK